MVGSWLDHVGLRYSAPATRATTHSPLRGLTSAELPTPPGDTLSSCQVAMVMSHISKMSHVSLKYSESTRLLGGLVERFLHDLDHVGSTAVQLASASTCTSASVPTAWIQIDHRLCQTKRCLPNPVRSLGHGHIMSHDVTCGSVPTWLAFIVSPSTFSTSWI